jgi:glyoxylase-like metal-dependent hydrolase (beta-lactamase superfamily II)
MDGREGAHGRAELVCHCLLVEAADRLVLVDTGFGLQDVSRPRERLSPLFLHVLCRPRLREADTAVRQIEAMGFSPNDVRDIVLTHLDFDHAGGLDDFPQARVHLLGAERQVATAQRGWLARQRFRPEQWTSLPRWISHRTMDSRWFGFEAVTELDDLPPEILLIPLPGHTMGHAGVAVRDGEGWLLHAGDAYFHRGEMDPHRYHCTPGLRAYQRLMETDRELRLENQLRLRELVHAHGRDVRVFCAHDAVEFERLAARAAEQPRVEEREGEAPKVGIETRVPPGHPRPAAQTVNGRSARGAHHR